MNKKTIDMEKHIEICKEYERKINDLYSKLSKLSDDYYDLKDNGQYFDYEDIEKAYKWIKTLFDTNKKLYTENCYARENIDTQEKAIFELDCMFYRISENYRKLVSKEIEKENEESENRNS